VDSRARKHNDHAGRLIVPAESDDGSPASRLASAASADQSRSAAPMASSVRKRSRMRLATGMDTCKASAALRAKWMSLKPSFALKPGGV